MRVLRIVDNVYGRVPLTERFHNFHGLPFTSMKRNTSNKRHSRKESFMSSTTAREEQWTAQRVRETFLKYFKEKGHTFGEIDSQIITQLLILIKIL